LLGVSLIASFACASAVNPPSGFVITNARVIDGSGCPSRTTSVRIEGERIGAVGDFEPASNDTVIDAGGLVLAPGFIDIHSHHDIGLFEIPDALAVVSQGVTTIVVGQDGGQQHPLAEYFARLEGSPVAVNVASYAGHGDLRSMIMGEDYRRKATPEEVERMATLLRTEMEAGALGLATGLEYDPGSFSETPELVELAKVAASYGGGYVSHIRSEDQFFWEALNEIIEIGRKARLPVHVSHIKLAMTRWWGQADRLVNVLDSARASGVDITADIYPYRAWQTDFLWLVTLFPDRDLDRREGAEYILGEMLSPEGILLTVYPPDPANAGMTIGEIAAVRGSDPVTTLIALLKADLEMTEEGDAEGASMLGYAMDEPDIEHIMAWPHTVIGSDGELAGTHPRGFGSFTRFLGHYIRERRVVGLEEGVRKATSLAASHAGITERGLIDVGYYGDLVLFDPESIIDRSTSVEPHAVSVGIDKVWVNGQLVFDGSEGIANDKGAHHRRRHHHRLDDGRGIRIRWRQIFGSNRFGMAGSGARTGGRSLLRVGSTRLTGLRPGSGSQG
jgi:N-acyl-D-amino-acid deacylase